MLHWLKKVFGKSNDFDGAGRGAIEAWGTALECFLAPLDGIQGQGVRSGLAADMIAFVGTGEPMTVLHEVSQQGAVGQVLGLGYNSMLTEDRRARCAVYGGIEQVPPAMLVRWGRVLEAAMTSSRPNWGIEVEGDRHWLEALVVHACGVGMHSYSKRRVAPPAQLTATLVEALLVSDGAPAEALVRAAFASPIDTRDWSSCRVVLLSYLPGFAAAVQCHVDMVRGLLRPPALPQRLHCMALLEGAHDATLAALAEPIVEHVTSNSKQLRAAAEPLARRAAAAVVPLLREQAVAGKPEQRLQALRLLAVLAREQGDPALLDFARTTAAADKAPSVQALVGEWEATQAATDPALATRYDYEVPEIDWRVEITPALDAALQQLWRRIGTEIDKLNQRIRKHNADHKAAGRNYSQAEVDPYPPEAAKQLRAWLESDAPRGQKPKVTARPLVVEALVELVRAADVDPVAATKLLDSFGFLGADDNLSSQAVELYEALHQKIGRPTLLEVRTLLGHLGLPAEAVLNGYCSIWRQFARGWPRDHVWPFFAHELDLVVATLGQARTGYLFDRDRLFAGIATLPTPPAVLVEKLFELALGPGKGDRRSAQDALDNLPGKEARIVLALADGKADTRAVAAQWLQRLGHVEAVAALEAAMAKEKHDVAKGALLDALEALGCPVEKYLDRDQLLQDAQKGLAKGLPKELAWLPREVLPAVRWREGGAVVPPDVLVWLCVQATKQKSPEPNVMLRKYCAMLEPGSAQDLAQTLLEAWLRADVAPITAEAAEAAAATQAKYLHASMQSHPKYYQDDPNLGLSVEELTARFLPKLLRQPRGSEIASKGVLAVVAACGGERVATPVGRYLKEWYGTRAAQGKALIAMLAWVEHPAAIQLMLSIGNRFRTKSFQEEATKQAEALAERRGWTLAELADRTMPTAGFDDDGVLELDYGGRKFTAHLHADHAVELQNPDGKKISALPSPRSDDDPELAKGAKKALSAAKKELKNIVALQTDRLYEALCTERDWSAADWTTYLQPHPVVRHLLQRLVWVEFADGVKARTFRLLDDGTLTDVDDGAVELQEDARVRLAHDTLLDADEIGAWQRHLVDYEVKPLFQQLGKGTYALPADKAAAVSIDDYQGHLLEAFALRGRAGKLGYVRGSTEDGGWFFSYEKRFPTLGMSAVIEFTGNPLPETNRTVALKSLSFRRAGADRGAADMALGEVPKVLLSECYQDLRLCAAEGTGFAADWEKRTEY